MSQRRACQVVPGFVTMPRARVRRTRNGQTSNRGVCFPADVGGNVARCVRTRATGSGDTHRGAARRHGAARVHGRRVRGPAWTILPSGQKHTITQTERIGSFLDGSVKVIEGRGYEPDGRVGFNAFGTISYNPATRAYTKKAIWSPKLWRRLALRLTVRATAGTSEVLKENLRGRRTGLRP